jgi:hypothetical protein
MPLDTGLTPGPVDPLEAIERRITNMSEWLRENSPYCFHDQKHLDEDTVERTYWHYGYLVALKDVRRLLKEPNDAVR